MNEKKNDFFKYKILVNSEKLLRDINLLAVQIKNKYKDEILHSLVLDGGQILFKLISNSIGNNLIKLNISKNDINFDLDLSNLSSQKIINKNIVLFDGIVISGKTHLSLITNILKHNPKSVALVTLAKKNGHLNFEKTTFFTIYTFDKEFVAGCGIGKTEHSNSQFLYDLSFRTDQSVIKI